MSQNETDSPKDRRRERTRQEILRAAAQVFAEKGFHDATIQDIARVAEFSTGSLYNYFDNKETLFHDLVEDVFENFQGLMLPADPDQDLHVWLRAQVHALLNFGDTYRNHFRLFMVLQWSESAWLGRQMQPAAQQRQQAMAVHFISMIGAAIERGELPEQSAEHAAIMLFSSIMGFTMRWFHGMGPERLADDTDALVALVLHGLHGCPSR